jgi:adenine-specific DNA-methyltransferase
MSHSRLVPEFAFTEARLEHLKAIAPEAFADGKVNWEALRESLGDYLEPDEAGAEHFGLSWPGKREARRVAALPGRGALVPAAGEGVNEDQTANIFIEGENLEVLKLLQKAYAGRVGMIYIDPPYNTGNDFIYNDDFADPLGEYLQKTGQADVRGTLTTNTRADGRFHSNWLSMIYPRLRLSRALLSEDGFLFVSIDDNEVHNLRHVLNEVFGEEALVACFVWKRRPVPDSRNESKASTDHEYVICYRRTSRALRGASRNTDLYSNPDNDPRGPWTSTDLTGLATRDQRPNLHYAVTDPKTGRTYPPSPDRGWAISREKFGEYIGNDRILWPRTAKGRPRLKRFLSDAKEDTTALSSILDVGPTQEGTKEIQDLFGDKVMAFTKPLSLMRLLVHQGTGPTSLVLDFFAGSCTTAQAVMEANREDGGSRRYLCVQMPESVEADSVAAKAGYSTIAEIGKERLRRVIKKLKQEAKPSSNEDLGFRVLKLTKSHFKAWQDYAGHDLEQLQILFDEAQDPLVKGWTPNALLTEIMLLEGFPLDSTISEVADTPGNDVRVVTSDHSAHRVLVCLDQQLDGNTVDGLALHEADVFVCLDAALTDQVKQRLSDRCTLKTI